MKGEATQAAWFRSNAASSTIDVMVASRELPVRRIGRRVVISQRALQNFARRDHPTKGTDGGRVNPTVVGTLPATAGH